MLKRAGSAFWSSPAPGWRITRIVLLLLILSALCVMLFEKKLIYHPSRYPEGFWNVGRIQPDGEAIVPAIEDVNLTTGDGVKIHGWYARPVRGAARKPVPTKGTLLFLHGNAGNISHRFGLIRLLTELPVDVFIPDYRGYGKSEGSPSEEGLYRDAEAAYAFLTDSRGIPPDRLVLYGESLGGAVCVELARRRPCAGLILESTFTSVPAMARHILPFPPLWLCLRTRFDSLSKIGSIKAPKLFIHSPEDEVVPYSMGRKLFERAADPKEFWKVPRARHGEVFLVEPEEFSRRLRAFLDGVLKNPAGTCRNPQRTPDRSR